LVSEPVFEILLLVNDTIVIGSLDASNNPDLRYFSYFEFIGTEDKGGDHSALAASGVTECEEELLISKMTNLLKRCLRHVNNIVE